MLHQDIHLHAGADFGPWIDAGRGGQFGFLDLTDADDAGRASGNGGGSVIRQRDAQRVVILSIVRALVGIGVGRAAAVVVGRVFGYRRILADHVLVGQVETQVAEFAGVGTAQGRCADAIRADQVVGGIALGRIRQEVLDRDAAALVICRVVEGDALDVHLVLGSVDFNLVEVHVLSRNHRACTVAAHAFLVRQGTGRCACSAVLHRDNLVQRLPGGADRADVTAQASFLAGFALPVVTLRRAGIGSRVALAAVAQVLREADLGVAVLAVLVTPDGVVLAGAVETFAGMDLVHHGGEIEVVAAVGVDRAGVVAEHAVLGVNAPAAVQAEFFMATVAGRHIGHLARPGRIGDQHRLAGSVHGEVNVRVDQNCLARRILVAQLNGDAVRACWLENDAIGLRRILDVGLEGVGVVAVGVVHQLCCQQGSIGLLGIGGRLHRAGERRLAGRADTGGCRFLAVDVIDPLVRVAIAAGNQFGDGEADVGDLQIRFHGTV